MSSGKAQRRSGCLGCLPRLLLTLAVAGVALLLVTAVFAPWGFFLGGHFHIIPYWQGWGIIHAKSGKYVVFVRFEPRPSGSRIMPHPSVGGRGYLCSPRGEIFAMHIDGGMRRGIGLSTEGENISLGMDYWPTFSSFTGNHRPAIAVKGKWQNPNIIGDDNGSISRAFNPDGSVASPDPHRPYPGDITPVTLVPGSYFDFQAACKQH